MEITVAYKVLRKQAIAWLKSNRDFNEGLSILRNSGYRPHIASKIGKWGDNKHSHDKLLNELRNFIKCWNNDDPIVGAKDDSESASPFDRENEEMDILTQAKALGFDESVSDSVSNPDTGSYDNNQTVENGNEDSYKNEDVQHLPMIIQRLICSFADLYRQRSILHAALSEVPENNDPTNCENRKSICLAIDGISTKMDKLYSLKKLFDNEGLIPEQDLLEKSLLDEVVSDNNILNDDDKVNDNLGLDDDKVVVDVDLPESISELKKLRKNSCTKLSRAKNQLLYQQDTKADVEFPLPEGAKRIKISKKVLRLSALIKKIDIQIAKLS